MQAACWEESEGQGESEEQGYWGALTRPSATLSQRERGWVWDGTGAAPLGNPHEALASSAAAA